MKNWIGARNADQFGPRCMQRSGGDYWFRGNGMSEDCLFLNVWTPAKSGSERLPVLVYVVGGGFVLDRTNGELLLGKPFVKKMTWAKEIGADGRPVLLEGGTPSAAGTKTCPQVRGATNWYSTAFSPATNLFYVMAVEDCSIYRQSRGYVPYLDPADPPRKFLKAINIDSGPVAWESEESGAPEANYSGVLATAGGLVFHGETSGSFNAADAKTGRSLWHFNANEAWKASPMTYAIGDTQFVAIAGASGAILSFSLNSQ